jgi:hypothetical protein
MFRVLTTAVLFLVSATAYAQTNGAFVDEYNVPTALQKCMQSKAVSDLQMTNRVNPFFLRGDFDGDGKLDYAVLVTQRTTGKQGIVICVTGRSIPAVISAGRSLGEPNDDDLRGYDAWKVDDRQQPVVSPPREAILVIAKESASAVIYWDGKQFRWKQLGF